ncbi:hypothetical protein SNEBB_009838 [Seison nebaliae]|nr:hypothetical protein SNEBB_009838 [Seison nebaliae]
MVCNDFKQYSFNNQNFIHISKFRDILKKETVNFMKFNLENVEGLTDYVNDGLNSENTDKDLLNFQMLKNAYGEQKEISDYEFDEIYDETFRLLLKTNHIDNQPYRLNNSYNLVNQYRLEIFVNRAKKLLVNRVEKNVQKFMKNRTITLNAIIHVLVNCNETIERATRFILPFAKYTAGRNCGGNVLYKSIRYNAFHDIYLFGIAERN